MHVVSFVSWFSGLLYLVRLYVYHAEAQDKSPIPRKILSTHFLVMEYRLWRYICVPAAWMTVITGSILVWEIQAIKEKWFQMKFLFLLVLFFYHGICGSIRREFSRGNFQRWTSLRLRIFNELATTLLICIVFLAIIKKVFLALGLAVGFFGFLLCLAYGIFWFRRKKH